MNSTLKHIEERYTCRSFTNQKVEKEHLEAISQSAIQSPSGMNRQNWQIIVVNNKSIIEEMDAEGMKVLAGMDGMGAYQRIMSRGGRLFYNAPCMVLVAVKESEPKGAELIDLGIVAQNVVLSATSLGIASCHCGLVGLTFAGDKADYFKQKLRFFEGYQCGMAVLLGYPVASGTPHEPDQSKITIIE